MGTYDTIFFNCLSCGTELSAQSKSGECKLKEYSYKEVPIDVAYDVNRHAPFNCECGKKYIFSIISECEDDVVSLEFEEYRSDQEENFYGGIAL